MKEECKQKNKTTTQNPNEHAENKMELRCLCSAVLFCGAGSTLQSRRGFVFHGRMAPFKDAALINITLNNQIILDHSKVLANGREYVAYIWPLSSQIMQS